MEQRLDQVTGGTTSSARTRSSPGGPGAHRRDRPRRYRQPRSRSSLWYPQLPGRRAMTTHPVCVLTRASPAGAVPRFRRRPDDHGPAQELVIATSASCRDEDATTTSTTTVSAGGPTREFTLHPSPAADQRPDLPATDPDFPAAVSTTPGPAFTSRVASPGPSSTNSRSKDVRHRRLARRLPQFQLRPAASSSGSAALRPRSLMSGIVSTSGICSPRNGRSSPRTTRAIGASA